MCSLRHSTGGSISSSHTYPILVPHHLKFFSPASFPCATDPASIGHLESGSGIEYVLKSSAFSDWEAVGESSFMVRLAVWKRFSGFSISHSVLKNKGDDACKQPTCSHGDVKLRSHSSMAVYAAIHFRCLMRREGALRRGACLVYIVLLQVLIL